MNHDEKLMQHVDSRMMKYPGVLDSTDKFESEETTEWDKAFALADMLIEKGYDVPDVDKYTLAEHIMKKWKIIKDAEAAKIEKETIWEA